MGLRLRRIPFAAFPKQQKSPPGEGEPFAALFSQRKIDLRCTAVAPPIIVMRELPHTHHCFVCGESNAVGLKLRFTTDGRVVQTRFRLRAAHIGFRGVVHGGILTTVLDEIMVWACAVPTRQFAFCAELTVRFLNPVRPDDEIIATGELLTNRKNRIFEAKGVLANSSGQPFAEATGKYLPIPKSDLTGMMTDLIGDTSWLRDGADSPAR
jgi:uncharacterized protein (TIGR00369 family)